MVKQNRKLLKSKPYKKQSASLDNILKMEIRIAGKFITQITADFKNPNKINFGWWEREFKKLNILNKKKDVEMQKMVYRLKFDLYARLYSRKKALRYNSNQEQVEIIERFLKLIYPK